MAEEENLEGRMKSESPGESQLETTLDKEEQKQEKKNGFENKGRIRRYIDYAIGAGSVVAAGYYALGWWIAVPAITRYLGEVIANKRKKIRMTSAQFRDSMLLTSAFSIPVFYGFNMLNKYIDMSTWAGKITRTVAQTLLFTPLGYLGLGAEYLVRNKKIKGVYKEGVKPYFWRNARDGALLSGIPNALAAWTLPAWTHFPISCLVGLLGKATIGVRQMMGLDPYGQLNGNGNGAGKAGKNGLSKNYASNKDYTKQAYQPQTAHA